MLQISKPRRVLTAVCGAAFGCAIGFAALGVGLSIWWVIPIMMTAQVPFWWLDGVVEAKVKDAPA